MPLSRKRLEQLKKKYEQRLFSFPNVVGIGIGVKETKQVSTGKLCLKVYVTQKIPKGKLHENALITEKLGGIEIDVEEVGRLEAQ